MDKDKALHMALKAFEWNYNTDLDNIPACEKWAKMLKENITAIKEALAQPDQEPVSSDEDLFKDDATRPWYTIDELNAWAEKYQNEQIAKLREKNGG